MDVRKFVFFCLLLTLLLPCPAFSQVKGAVSLSGVVRDEQGAPVSDAIVQVVSPDGKVLYGYDLSAKDGKYALSVRIPAGGEAVVVRCKLLGYKDYSDRFAPLPSHLDIVLKESSVTLREVTVKAVPVNQKGDTINYNALFLSSKGDNALEDLIRRIPGVRVEASGRILYNEKPINKFYIEGLDLLKNKYTIATKNINPDDVASISVYENHEPVKLLRGLSNQDAAALDIKLKENAKLRPVGYLETGAGIGEGFLFRLGGFALKVSPGSQQLYELKGDNLGTNLIDELMPRITLAGDDEELPIRGVIPDNITGYSPPIPPERYKKGYGVLGDYHSIAKLRNDAELSLNLSVGYSKKDIMEYSRESYLLPDQNVPLISIDDAVQSSIGAWSIDAGIEYETNDSLRYLKNRTSIVGEVSDNAYVISRRVNEERFTQRFRAPYLRVQNDTRLLSRNGLRVQGVSGRISFLSAPGQMLSIASGNGSSEQEVQSQRLSTSWSSSYVLPLGGAWTFGVKGDLGGAFDTLKTGSDIGENDLSGFSLFVSPSPYFRYSFSRVSCELGTPMELQLLYFRNLTGESANPGVYFSPNAYLSVSYEFTRSDKISVTGGTTKTYGTLLDFLTQPIHTSYYERRTLGAGTLKKGRTYRGTINWTHKDVLNGLHLTLLGVLLTGGSDQVVSDQITEDSAQSGIAAGRNRFGTQSLNLIFQKNFFEQNTILRLNGALSNSSFSLMRNGHDFSHRLLNWNIETVLSSDFLRRRMNVELQGNYMGSRFPSIEQTDMTLFGYKIRLNFSFLNNWLVGGVFSQDWVGNRHNGFNRFNNAEAFLRWSKGKYRIRLSGNNLTGNGTYSSVTAGMGVMRVHSVTLRPREVVLTFRMMF